MPEPIEERIEALALDIVDAVPRLASLQQRHVYMVAERMAGGIQDALRAGQEVDTADLLADLIILLDGLGYYPPADRIKQALLDKGKSERQARWRAA